MMVLGIDNTLKMIINHDAYEGGWDRSFHGVFFMFFMSFMANKKS